MTPEVEGGLLAVVSMGSSFLLALALSNSKIQMMRDLLNQERELRLRADREAKLAERIDLIQVTSETLRQTVDSLDLTVGKMVTTMIQGGHLSRETSPAPMEPGAMTVRFGERQRRSPEAQNSRFRSSEPEPPI